MTIDPGSRVGLLGGSFNPIHIGHIHVAQQVRNQVGLQEVWFIPTGNHPQRDSKYSKLRMKILKETLKVNERFRLIDYELKKKRKCYTYDTVCYLREKYPNIEFILIIGADQAKEFETWYKHDKLMSSVRIVVVSRRGFKMPRRLHHWLTEIKVQNIDLSSTMIRELGEEVAEMKRGWIRKEESS